MKNDKILKFENETRLGELNPKDTLIKTGFKDGLNLCDIGAGTGIFSFPASQISSSDIYALDISYEMIEILSNRKAERNINNLIIKKVDSDELPLKNNSCNMALMVTVFHEIDDKYSMLKEIKRILKQSGKLILIDFHKRETPIGPPVGHRISEEDAEKICNDNGLKTIDRFSLGDNFYSLIFQY